MPAKTLLRVRDSRWCELSVSLEAGRLSITGMEGRIAKRASRGDDVYMRTKSGKLIVESCGQIVDTLAKWFPECQPYLPWHLNDMHAACEHQEARGETYVTHLMAVCPDCGYKLGSQWLKRELPAEVIAWFENLQEERAA